ncbi:hypothetical protein B5C34_05340 [Pacificimonas flava]|uniref:ArsR family transcriptional regulator n=2 Tax=Pacificimonas TaxID=1960290 RepID=A0A219B499_9SPHN|nr:MULTISPECIES: hypothetical protein [Pacificimonas]MBZ6377356.1 hypothetical protein [Pacificimonas aurantium]OWV32936.1 hypothetical protein B5C34_05340 [Pacificimonas flava]
MSETIRHIVRRAILELLADIGGRHNDAELKLLLQPMGHRVSGREIRADLQQLCDERLVALEAVGGYLIAEITEDGRDCAEGNLVAPGVYRHRVMR